MRSREFAHAAKSSDNYYVLVAREALPQLPYSVDEIYELRNTGRSSSKYPAYSRTYTSTHKVYGPRQFDALGRTLWWSRTATRASTSSQRFVRRAEFPA